MKPRIGEMWQAAGFQAIAFWWSFLYRLGYLNMARNQYEWGYSYTAVWEWKGTEVATRKSQRIYWNFPGEPLCTSIPIRSAAMRSFAPVAAPSARRKVYVTYIICEPTNLPTLRHLILPSKVYGFRVRLPLLYSGQTMAPVISLRYCWLGGNTADGVATLTFFFNIWFNAKLCCYKLHIRELRAELYTKHQ